MIIFSICQNFSVFRRGHHQRIFEIFEKVEYLHDHEELDIGNGTVIFSERSSFVKLTIFKIWPYLKLSIF